LLRRLRGQIPPLEYRFDGLPFLVADAEHLRHPRFQIVAIRCVGKPHGGVVVNSLVHQPEIGLAESRHFHVRDLRLPGRPSITNADPGFREREAFSERVELVLSQLAEESGWIALPQLAFQECC
jgi:hypothetical protein